MKWISVLDELPKDEKSYLVTNGYDVGIYWYVKIRNAWYPGGWPVGNTTHWGNIPKLPKLKGDENEI